MPIVVSKGALIPFKGLILDHYRPETDDALLVICKKCFRWRIVRGDPESVPGYKGRSETHRMETFCNQH